MSNQMIIIRGHPNKFIKIYQRFIITMIKQGKIKLMIIPDIESVNYGRGVGYQVIEHIPPSDISDISATKIREQMKTDGKL